MWQPTSNTGKQRLVQDKGEGPCKWWAENRPKVKRAPANLTRAEQGWVFPGTVHES